LSLASAVTYYWHFCLPEHCRCSCRVELFLSPAQDHAVVQVVGVSWSRKARNPNLWLSCIRSLAEEKDGNVVEHPGLVEVGVEHHLPHSQVSAGISLRGGGGVPLPHPGGQRGGRVTCHTMSCRQNNPLIDEGSSTGKLAGRVKNCNHPGELSLPGEAVRRSRRHNLGVSSPAGPVRLGDESGDTAIPVVQRT